jgi:tRNA threonylcarbamoyladenosine biosynthesis protein TsaB
VTVVLGIDTSGDACAVALLDGDDVLAERGREMTRGHAEALVPMIMDAIGAAGGSATDIAVVGVAVGPGSFTGIRTGIAAARGFALASGACAVGVSSLEATAFAAFAARPDAARTACILETRRADYFCQIFAPGPEALGPPAVLAAAELRARVNGEDLLAGNGVERFRRETGDATGGEAFAGATFGAAEVARLASRSHAAAAGEKGLERTLSPLYLRPAEAKRPLDGGRLRE